MLNIGFGWASLVLVGVFTVLLNIFIVKYYSDRHQSETLTTVVTVIALSITLLCVLVIPVDILNVSTMSNAAGNHTINQHDIDQRNLSIAVTYYILYSLIILFALIIIPFVYFYYEEDDVDVSIRDRVVGACKYTAFLVVFTVVMLVVGIFIRPGSSKPVGNENVKDWIQTEILSQNAAQGSLMFSVAILTLLGFVVWMVYTAYGLAAMPIDMIKGMRRLSDDRRQISESLYDTRSQASYYSSKYASGKTMSAKEEHTLSLLRSKERALEKHSERMEASHSGLRRILIVFKPFTFIFGFFFLLVSILIVISIMLSLIDKVTNSICGSSCGFLTDYPKLKNPIDLLLQSTAPYFPLDYIILGLFIVYIYAVTVSGVVKIGIRFLWIKLYEFNAQKTMPQGLLLCSILLMLSNLCLNLQIVQLAPQYSMFGTQVWYNATSDSIEPCSINAPADSCVMTQIGLITSRIVMGTNFFGIIYYYATWAIIGAFLIGSIIAVVKRRRSNIVSYADDSDEEI
ncbi:hypothetical protein SAMD00019534_102220 [Acytostelium subglobosum LB1]|uniref:hypothetical protein n=1 Tax=Acytostelium subglobosum LB1 TaxID=1410327 RepID=UPI000644AD3F|nr:hypothetical protein SAMD00019534_102220 [Acytostelium subglobosum LB1]GAM27047.1 hypothetical protein SAMD00019534_102220 [Acytostelium subglobosum LB1]|eukprot:XP_012749927.1 hypothetical protein SAMD00019534_102220 [Acytostelium subglobosum LB1]